MTRVILDLLLILIDQPERTGLRQRANLSVSLHLEATNEQLRAPFFRKIQDWILKSGSGFSVKQINPRSLGSWCIVGTEESMLRVDSSVPLTTHGPRDWIGLIGLEKKRNIGFRI